MARTMLAESTLPKKLYAKVVSISCYIVNRAMVRLILKKTPHELLKGKKPNLSYFKPFGIKCFIHNNNKENLNKFEAKSQEGFFLGYSTNSRAYKVFNIRN